MDQPSFIDPARIADLPEVPETERAWAAGFFDGEGCCGAYRTKRNPEPTRIQLSVSQTETTTLRRFHLAMGNAGYLQFVERSAAKPKWNDCWSLLLTAIDEVSQAVALMWPYLSGPKRQQIQRAFAARAANLRTTSDLPIGGQKLTDAQVARIKDLLTERRLLQREIAQMFGVQQSHISTIALGKRKAAGERARAGRKRRPVVWPDHDVAGFDPPSCAADHLAFGEPSAEIERAWAAGFFDAEGTATARLGRHLALSVAQTETSTLDRFMRAMGGIGGVYSKYQSNQPEHWKQGYYYSIGSKGDWAVAVGKLWPYVSPPKRRQITEAWLARSQYRETWPAEFNLPNQRLSNEQIEQIRDLANAGQPRAEVARQFGISGSYVGQIKRGARRASDT